MMQAFADILENEPGLIIPVFAIAAGLTFALIIITITSVIGVIKARHIEITRREIAAYIAEGSISADEGERLIRAESPSSKCCS